MQGLGADVARLTFRVVRAFLDRDRDGLRTLPISVVLFGAACFFYFLADVLVAAFFPVQLLAFARSGVWQFNTAAPCGPVGAAGGAAVRIISGQPQ